MNIFDDYNLNPTERFLDSFLSKNIYGKLIVTFPSGRKKIYYPSSSKLDDFNSGMQADIKLNNFKLIYKLLRKGSVGFAESYIDSDFETNNLSNLLLFAHKNESSYIKKREGNFLNDIIVKFKHFLNENTRYKSKKNISYHYDLGNNFYKHWLDESMTYSSAVFEQNNENLFIAQQNKYRQIAEPLQLNENSNLLEIGCGWGGFSTYAAKKFGAKIRAITLSKEQFDFTSKKIAKEGLGEKIIVEIRDYRDVKEKYSSIASIEMFEAVGKKYWRNFFEKIRNSLTSKGIASMQIITIDDNKADRYQNNPDFIQQYIFPGGVLPSKKQLQEVTNSLGIKISECKSFNSSYAKTLNLWNQKFQNSWNLISKEGFNLRFKRMWEYYLSYCEVGFISGATDVSQFLIKK